MSPRCRTTERFATSGEHAEAGIPLYWRVELEPAVVVHAFVLDGNVPVEDLRTPWGSLTGELGL